MDGTRQLKITLNSDLIEGFKKKCENNQVSMASVLKQYMEEYAERTKNNKRIPDYSTRRKRRKKINSIVTQLSSIRDSEIQYRDRIPENLQESLVYERADEIVDILEEAIDLLGSV